MFNFYMFWLTELFCVAVKLKKKIFFLYKTLAAYSEPLSYLRIYSIVNLAFVCYLDKLHQFLEIPVLSNLTIYEQILPISLEPD